MKPLKNMASTLCVLLSLALFAYTVASPIPVPDGTETTTAADYEEVVPLYAVVEVIEEVPEIVAFVEATTTEAPEEAAHIVARRSLRGDNPNELLSDFDGLNYDNGLMGLAGRRIKTLPSWVGK